MAAPGLSNPAALPCFAVPTGHEIASGGRKLVGSAQKWSRRGFLQHGSILLDLDAELWSKVTGLAPGALTVAVGLRELAGRPVPPRQLVKILREEFEAAMGERASESRLSPGERRAAELLAQSKYSSPEWNLCRTRGSFRPPAHMLF
jgi:lipoate-protein ligase A